MSDWKTLNGGIPQGTKLGVILFAVMANRLLRHWHLRTKFVDDTTAVEILPRNSISYINMVADDVHRFSTSHRMKLNPVKCKEMIINFMAYPNFSVRPICIGDSVVECVKSYKLLGVYIDNDLKWNSHIDYIVKKSSKKLYSLRLLKRSVVEPENILKVYLSTIRPVLEYAIPIWKSIPDYLSDRVESIQRRALRIIYPEAESYDQSLRVAKLETLASRRISLCTKYMNKIKTSESHPLHKLLPRKHNRDIGYHLRGKQDETYLFHNHTACRTNRSEDFLMFKYF